MTVPVFYATPDKLAADRFVLDGDEGRHASTVRRLRVGERLDIGDGGGLIVECVVTAVRRAALEVAVTARREIPAAQPRVVVVQALIKGERGERAVETMTEVGVDVIVPWQAARCVTRWDADRATRGAARWRVSAREAAKQSRRAWVPHVVEPAATSDVLARVGGAALAVVLHESATESLAGAARGVAGPADIGWPVHDDIVLVVGPEGGLAPEEVEALVAAGGLVRRLGPTVLRASTAGSVAATLALAASGRLA